MPKIKRNQDTVLERSKANLGRILRDQGRTGAQAAQSKIDAETLASYRAGRTGPTWERLVMLLRSGVLTPAALAAAVELDAPEDPTVEEMETAWAHAWGLLVRHVAGRRGLDGSEVRRRLGFSHLHVLRHELAWHEKTIDQRRDEEGARDREKRQFEAELARSDLSDAERSRLASELAAINQLDASPIQPFPTAGVQSSLPGIEELLRPGRAPA